MRIGIDISQVVYEGTGVGRYVREMVRNILAADPSNEYVLFGSSLRKKSVLLEFFTSLRVDPKRVTFVYLPIPPTILDVLWNRLHILPIELFIGRVDIFWSSDWTQPPLQQALGVTTIHDLNFLHYPAEAHNTTEVSAATLQIVANIPGVQERRLQRAKVECSLFFCDSKATARDVMQYLGIRKEKIRVIYPGFS